MKRIVAVLAFLNVRWDRLYACERSASQYYRYQPHGRVHFRDTICERRHLGVGT